MADRFDEIFTQLRNGRMVVMIAEEHEDAEGDLVMAADLITPDHVNFMVREGRGVVSVAVTDKRMRELGIPLEGSAEGGEEVEPAGALVEARAGVSTGISTPDRARTISVIASRESTPEDIVMPGHVLPLMAMSGGVMMRIGRAEGAVDLVRCAGLGHTAAMCAILRDDGETARLPDLREFAKRHSLPICFIPDLVSYRLTHETLVQRITEVPFELDAGSFSAVIFRNIVDGREHLALIKGNVGGGRPALVRLHSECLT
ncbi:MAG TPA: 3,4-dihydroxy-2-butanone-4-phosphate synthase, partial [Candidatus Binataceae bacterium]|nr:3,4-dihydroxy-2-butanone-4-phosphate synthase [Candidatus Binataceae bacterium]